jgi:hypothetical protein
MRKLMLAFAATAVVISVPMAASVRAEDTTVIKKTNDDGDQTKTVIKKHDDDSDKKVIIRKDRDND